jgi:hypothetical protein
MAANFLIQKSISSVIVDNDGTKSIPSAINASPAYARVSGRGKADPDHRSN